MQVQQRMTARPTAAAACRCIARVARVRAVRTPCASLHCRQPGRRPVCTRPLTPCVPGRHPPAQCCPGPHTHPACQCVRPGRGRGCFGQVFVAVGRQCGQGTVWPCHMHAWANPGPHVRGAPPPARSAAASQRRRGGRRGRPRARGAASTSSDESEADQPHCCSWHPPPACAAAQVRGAGSKGRGGRNGACKRTRSAISGNTGARSPSRAPGPWQARRAARGRPRSAPCTPPAQLRGVGVKWCACAKFARHRVRSARAPLCVPVCTCMHLASPSSHWPPPAFVYVFAIAHQGILQAPHVPRPALLLPMGMLCVQPGSVCAAGWMCAPHRAHTTATPSSCTRSFAHPELFLAPRTPSRSSPLVAQPCRACCAHRQLPPPSP